MCDGCCSFMLGLANPSPLPSADLALFGLLTPSLPQLFVADFDKSQTTVSKYPEFSRSFVFILIFKTALLKSQICTLSVHYLWPIIKQTLARQDVNVR